MKIKSWAGLDDLRGARARAAPQACDDSLAEGRSLSANTVPSTVSGELANHTSDTLTARMNLASAGQVDGSPRPSVAQSASRNG